MAEQDSLNASLLGPDAAPGTPEFDLFVKEVATEMTVKAGQKCTAIRRAMAPAQYLDAVERALGERLARTKVGDPRADDTRMGALVSISQRDDVREKIARARSGRRAHRRRRPERRAADSRRSVPAAGAAAHRRSVGHGRRARLRAVRTGVDDHALQGHRPTRSHLPTAAAGSLVLSLFTYSPDAARDFIQGAAAYHGRMLVLNRDNAAETTGHGSPLPVLVHGGPGRAGGSEEMGGIRGVKHYMQRTALQSSPAMIAAITEQYVPGAPKHVDRRPPVPPR